MKQYIDLMKNIMLNGSNKPNRTGIDTISIFGESFRHNMSDGFPLLTTKKIKWENIVLELMWFLSGDRSDKFFNKHNVKFWDSWKDNNGNLPQAYGEFWRKYPMLAEFKVKWHESKETPEDSGWMGYEEQNTFDQIAAIINELKNNQNSRRLVLDRWNAPISWQESLPPCALLSIFNVQYDINKNPKLNLHITMRSVDVPVGFPFNIAGFALLLSLISRLTNLELGEIHFILVDAHVYVNQIEGIEKQIIRKCFDLPQLVISDRIKNLSDIDDLVNNGNTQEILDCFKIVNYKSHPFIKFDVAV